MGTLQMKMNKFLGSFNDVMNMMRDVGLVSSHVFSYSVAQETSNMVVEERHLQIFIKFLEESKDMLNQFSNQLSHHRGKEEFDNIVLGFEDRQSIDIVSDPLNVSGTCGTDVKSHGNSFSASCESASYQMKNRSEPDVRFSTTTQQQYGSINESSCKISSDRFSPLNESQYNSTATLSTSRHFTVPVNRSCYDMTASSVGHENSLSSHSATFNLPNHMEVNLHFHASSESLFNGSSNQMVRFPSCSRDSTMKQFPSANESQTHESQFVPHDKSQDFTSKPSCEFAQANETRDSQQRFTSPRGHFSPTTESNCDTMYASRCDTTQDAHFSCDTTYETSNHSGHGMHTSSGPFQTTGEQSLNTHYTHASLATESGFVDPTKSQHSSAFSMINSIGASQYSTCQGNGEKAQFSTNEDVQNKMHYTQRSDLCEAPFPQMNGNNSFVGLSNESCNTQVTSRGMNETRYSHVSWDVLSDDDSYDRSSPVQPTNQMQEGSHFEELELAFSNQVDKDTSINDLKRNPAQNETMVTSGENSFTALLGARVVESSDDANKKKLSVLDDAKQEGGKWKCPLCGKLFIARINMERHFKVQHLGEKAFPCSLCEKGFSSKIRLDAHRMRQHNLISETANSCTVCGKLFNTKSALKIHSLTHVDESEKPFACNICNKRFSQKVVLDTHLMRHEGPTTYKYQCDICSKSFPTKPKLKFHWKKHEEAQFSCKQCSKQFSNESLLRVHEVTHLPLAQRPFQCPECPKGFTTKHKLQVHQETHAQSNQYSCSECSAVFKCRGTLVAHRRRRHSTSQQLPQANSRPPPSLSFKCPICLKTFNRSNNLRQHELSCHQDVPEHFSCEHCHKRFKSKRKLKIHAATHTEEPGLSCKTCGKRFYRSDLLRTHEATHTGNKPFSCEVCARRFATQAMLRSHQVIHQPQTETVPEVPCPTCCKKFKNKRTLALHMKSHGDSLDFKCGTCGKQFSRRVHYDGHMRTHSADRPYSCTVCNKTFRERKHRADHMKRLHPNEVLGGGELTLQKLIDSITADDTLDASTAGASFEGDINSDPLASLTELSNAGMQQLLEEPSQRNPESLIDETSQSQGSHQLNSSFGSQSRNMTLESQVENVNQNPQVNHLSHSFSSQPHNVSIDCQGDISGSSQVKQLPEHFSSQSQNLSILQNPFHHLKSEPDPFGCSSSGALSPLPELSDQLQSMETHSCSHSGLHSHYTHSCEDGKPNENVALDESLPKLSDVLALSMQGDI